VRNFIRKYSALLIVLLILLCGILGYLERTIWPAEAKVEGPPSFLRLHVLANSDSEKDQELKLAVRDLVLVELNSSIRDLKEFEQALQAVEAKLPTLQERIGTYLAEKKCGYTAQTKVGIEKMPAVSYGFLMLPEGDYWSLKITLGHGQGKNWWCVLFPPLCFLDLNDPEAVTVFAEIEERQKAAREDTKWQRWRDSLENEVRKFQSTQ